MMLVGNPYTIKREFKLTIPPNTDFGLWVPISRNNISCVYTTNISPTKVFKNLNSTVLYWSFFKSPTFKNINLFLEEGVGVLPKPPSKNSKFIEQCTNLYDDLTKPSEETANLAIGLTKFITDDDEKVNIIIKWLVSNLKYEYPPKTRDAILVLKNKYSDCGGYHAIFVSLLRTLNIPAVMDFGFRLPDYTSHVWSWWFNKKLNIWNMVDINDIQNCNKNYSRVSYSLGTNPIIENFPSKILFLQNYLTWDFNYENNKKLKTYAEIKNINSAFIKPY